MQTNSDNYIKAYSQMTKKKVMPPANKQVNDMSRLKSFINRENSYGSKNIQSKVKTLKD